MIENAVIRTLDRNIIYRGSPQLQRGLLVVIAHFLKYMLIDYLFQINFRLIQIKVLRFQDSFRGNQWKEYGSVPVYHFKVALNKAHGLLDELRDQRASHFFELIVGEEEHHSQGADVVHQVLQGENVDQLDQVRTRVAEAGDVTEE